MKQRTAWYDHTQPADVLGAIAHGPVVLARAPGITVALSHIAAVPEGFAFELHLRAEGAAGSAVMRQQQDFVLPSSWDRFGLDSLEEIEPSELTVLVTLDGQTAPPVESGGQSGGGPGSFEGVQNAWVGMLPTDGRATFTVGWPEVGLPETSVTLDLDLHDLDARMVRLTAT